MVTVTLSHHHRDRKEENTRWNRTIVTGVTKTSGSNRRWSGVSSLGSMSTIAPCYRQLARNRKGSPVRSYRPSQPPANHHQPSSRTDCGQRLITTGWTVGMNNTGGHLGPAVGLEAEVQARVVGNNIRCNWPLSNRHILHRWRSVGTRTSNSSNRLPSATGSSANSER